VKIRPKSGLQESIFSGDLIGYDGGSIMFFADCALEKKGYLNKMEIRFQIMTGERVQYVMNLRRIKALSDNDLREFLRGITGNPSPYYLQALDTVLKDRPSSLPFVVNQTTYYLDDERVALKLSSNGNAVGYAGERMDRFFFCFWDVKGFVQSLCVVERGLMLNLDSVSMVFHGSKCLNFSPYYCPDPGVSETRNMVEEAS